LSIWRRKRELKLLTTCGKRKRPEHKVDPLNEGNRRRPSKSQRGGKIKVTPRSIAALLQGLQRKRKTECQEGNTLKPNFARGR